MTPSITLSSDGEKRINVALEAGAAGDDHALYLAFANADMGADLASWAAFQRVGRVPAYATAASAAVSTLAAGSYSHCRVFLVENKLPYDYATPLLRQDRKQWINTGVKAGPGTRTEMTLKMDNDTNEQRPFGVDSGNAAVGFSYALFVGNNDHYWYTCCKDGAGDYVRQGWSLPLTQFQTIGLDANDGLAAGYVFSVTNRTTGGNTRAFQGNTQRTATSAWPIALFARATRNYSANTDTMAVDHFLEGAYIAACRIWNCDGLVRDYVPVSAIAGERIVYRVPPGSLASAQEIATVTVPGPLDPGDVVVSDGAAALGWTASVAFKEDALSPGHVTAYIRVAAARRTVMGTDSFESPARGTGVAELPGWSGTEASIGSGTPAIGDPPGLPIPAETHTNALWIGGQATRAYGDAFARDSQSVDVLLRVTRQKEQDWRSAIVPDSAAQLRLVFDPDGAPWLLHADDSGATVWTRLGTSAVNPRPVAGAGGAAPGDSGAAGAAGAGLPAPAFADGAWVRVSIDFDYASNPQGHAFAQVRLDGSCMVAPAGWRTPAAKGPVGGSWFLLPAPARSARKVTEIQFDGDTGVDDLVLAYHDAALPPDFATGSVASIGGIPLAWFDTIGIPRDPAGDPDGDGFANDAERRTGADPLDPSSHPVRATLLLLY